MIRVQREDFDVGVELDRLAAGNHRIGGVASFIGLVRDMGGRRPGLGADPRTLSRHDREEARRDRARGASALAARRLADHPPLRPARTRRPHRAGRHRLAAPRGRARRLPFPDRLAEDRRAVLEERGDARRRALGRSPRRGRRREGALGRDAGTRFQRQTAGPATESRSTTAARRHGAARACRRRRSNRR